MLTRKHSIEGKSPFGHAAELFDTLDADAAMKLAMVAGDVTLVLDDTGTILDAAFDPKDFPGFEGWVGTNWIETVTDESRPKIMEMLAAARRGEVQHWRQVNHSSREGEVPIRYAVLSVNKGEHRIAFGRDLREAGKLQARLLQVQQSLERDYLRMRQLEARYRMLFERSHEAVLVVEASSLRIREANPAAHALLGARAGSLPGKKLPGIVDKSARETLQTLVGAALASDAVSPVPIKLTRNTQVNVSVAGFTQDRGQFLLVRLAPAGESPGGASPVLDLIEQMPDAFVVADAGLEIVSANHAFIEMVQAASLDQLRGRHLSEWVGRPGIDLDLIEGQIDQHGAARNVGTVLRAGGEMEGEPVELSAVRSSGDNPLYAFVIRPIGRRLRDLPPGSQDLPRSVEQLTDLVGRMSLKDIVRESSDLIERLCIEAALSYTSDNRASAAEILGLSRQSLYSKLHRYGIGNLSSDPES
ncbi:transcriptional regulator PpsR [Erythrobacter sp. HL-111]|uniref:transcriptional regulator PpsR n=1 Tax=Erythrobacter sp. HL-111 TaxID=1798193 RepID=UPI0006D94B5C|nr:transcriptional regulator PpsR [Erythrobacter sp. HL-111]KPP93896.1 MAG: transcriptional repressor of photosystem genes PpsR [Erythrobacteraceae bacterium HL-111]SDS34936.1 transcriptional regulator PpsR [Erythrobacter sp. HL-111]